MPVTQHPLHRYVRAELPHTAPALGHDDQTLVGVSVADTRVSPTPPWISLLNYRNLAVSVDEDFYEVDGQQNFCQPNLACRAY